MRVQASQSWNDFISFWMLFFVFPTLSLPTANLISWPLQICPHVSVTITTRTIPVTSISPPELLQCPPPPQLTSPLSPLPLPTTRSHPAHAPGHSYGRRFSVAAHFTGNQAYTLLTSEVQAFPLSVALGHPHPESPVPLPHPCHRVLSQFLMHTQLFPGSAFAQPSPFLPSPFSCCKLTLRNLTLGLNTHTSDLEKVPAIPSLPLSSSISFAHIGTIATVLLTCQYRFI